MSNTPQAPGLDQGVLASSQVPGSPNFNSPFANVIPATVALTKDIYLASKPRPVQDLYKIDGQTGPNWAANRWYEALQVAMAGYVVDPYCDAQGTDPVVTMLLRSNMLIPYTAPLLSAVVFTPTPQQPLPSGPMPNGWIKTSLSPGDYPPFYPPAPPPPAPGAPGVNAVGNFQYTDGTNRWFGAGPGAFAAVATGAAQNNKPYAEGGVSYTAHVNFGLMGEQVSFSTPA